MRPALNAHIEAMAAARESGDLRTIHGHAYPVPDGELLRWQKQQSALREQKVKALLRSRLGARLQAESAFA